MVEWLTVAIGRIDFDEVSRLSAGISHLKIRAVNGRGIVRLEIPQDEAIAHTGLDVHLGHKFFVDDQIVVAGP